MIRSLESGVSVTTLARVASRLNFNLATSDEGVIDVLKIKTREMNEESTLACPEMTLTWVDDI